MKLSKILEISGALNVLANTKLPAKASYRVAKAINLITSELKVYDQARVKLAEELGTKSEDGSRFDFADDAAKSFNDQIQALLEEEVDITLPTVTPDELGAIEIEPLHLAILDGVIIKE